MSDQAALDLNELNEALWRFSNFRPGVMMDHERIITDAARRYAAGTLPAEFPTDEDVEVAWQKLMGLSGGFGPEIEYVEAALQAVAESRASRTAGTPARRTEEGGT